MQTSFILISLALLGTLFAEDRPNIIFILADDVQANSLVSKSPEVVEKLAATFRT
ncbi:MAG: hypothetical protein QGG53_37995 [Planctomycetota bacterium]|jgi:hypothetical protein|nr:hypothetical protein [Planctomycetota bacterium]